MISSFTRRQFMAGSVAAGSLALAGTMPGVMPAYAQEAKSHQLAVGDMSVQVFSDGIMDVPAAGLATNVPVEELNGFLTRNGLSTERRMSDLNVTMVRTGDDLVVIDTGSGMNFLDGAGLLSDSMDNAGVDHEKVTKVVLTHAHPDHVWGIIDDFEEAERFPNAHYFMSDVEWDFWMDKDILSTLPETLHGFAVGAQRNLKPVSEKMTFLKEGASPAPGLTMIATPGHTPGHMSVMLESGKDQLLVIGDAITHAQVSFAHPNWALQNDQDGELAAKTRIKTLDMLATDKVPVIGYHLPWPGVGSVEKKGSAYSYSAV